MRMFICKTFVKWKKYDLIHRRGCRMKGNLFTGLHENKSIIIFRENTCRNRFYIRQADEYILMTCCILHNYGLGWVWYHIVPSLCVHWIDKQYPCTGRCGGPRGCSRLPSFSTLPTVPFWFCQKRKDIVTSSVHNVFGLCGISTVYIFVFWYVENFDNELWSLLLLCISIFIVYLTGEKKRSWHRGLCNFLCKKITSICSQVFQIRVLSILLYFFGIRVFLLN